jgi:glycosyltransferase involved in cell wall biosynthesis
MPAVSVILPTYNRARFLPQALASIRSQTFTDWELIVVDDGSTDDTPAVIAEQTRGWPQPVRYVRQENRGAYGARNTGLDLVRGESVAFFDSDDVWLPHHLADCAAALADNPDVDWVYGACRMVDCATGRVVCPNTFYLPDGRPRDFLRLRARAAARLRVIDDRRVIACAVCQGLYSGL